MLRKYGVITLMVWAAIGVLLAILTGSGRVTGRVLEIVAPVAIGVSLFIAFSVLFAIFVHEIGHVVGGALAGFRFQAMQVGPFEVRSQGGRLRVGVVENPRLSGFVRMVPLHEERLVPRMLVFILGGPLASLLYAGLAYLLFRALPEPKHTTSLLSVVPHLASMSLFVMGLSILPGTLVPYTAANGNPTDMKVLLTLLGPKAIRERLVALVLIGRELQSGVRARNWSPSVIAQAVGLRDGRMEELRARILAYYHFEDLGEEREMFAHVERAVELGEAFGKKAGTLRELALCESAYASAWHGRDPEGASRTLAKVGDPSVVLKGTKGLAAAAIAARRGQTDEARELLIESHRAMEEIYSRYGGAIAYDEERIERIRSSIESGA